MATPEMTTNNETEELLAEILGTYQNVVLNGARREDPAVKFSSYAISAFRGGIGKSTLAFNLTYELAKQHRMLLLDVCPQRNFTELLLQDDIDTLETNTVYDALFDRVLGGGGYEDSEPLQLSYRVKDSNKHFSDVKPCWIIPGDSELFMFPAHLYTQLNQFYSLTNADKGRGQRMVGQTLRALRNIINQESKDLKPEITLIDTSPFFAGGTHLAWCAAEAVVIPVRVDNQSLFALELTLKMLDETTKEFLTWNSRSDHSHVPKIAALMMTHVGWNRQSQGGVDNASKIFIRRAVELANAFKHLFATPNVVDHFALLSDFQGSGRISGNQGIPLSQLRAGQKFSVNGQRVDVNESIARYKNEIAYATSLLA